MHYKPRSSKYLDSNGWQGEKIYDRPVDRNLELFFL